MARRVFFSFHYQRDSWRVSQVRNSWVARPGKEAQPFLDRAAWEEVERSGDAAIKRWIDSQLNGTSVTAVLIGAETYKRKWVKYEIQKSRELGKGLLGVRIHNVKDSRGMADMLGPDPFAACGIKNPGALASIYEPKLYEIYDWVLDDGRNKIGEWVEDAARRAGR